jgi:hypothetical protein
MSRVAKKYRGRHILLPEKTELVMECIERLDRSGGEAGEQAAKAF